MQVRSPIKATTTLQPDERCFWNRIVRLVVQCYLHIVGLPLPTSQVSMAQLGTLALYWYFAENLDFRKQHPRFTFEKARCDYDTLHGTPLVSWNECAVDTKRSRMYCHHAVHSFTADRHASWHRHLKMESGTSASSRFRQIQAPC